MYNFFRSRRAIKNKMPINSTRKERVESVNLAGAGKKNKNSVFSVAWLQHTDKPYSDDGKRGRKVDV